MTLKKTIALFIAVLFALSANVSCTGPLSINYPGNLETAGSPQTPNAPNTRLPQEVIDDEGVPTPQIVGDTPEKAPMLGVSLLSEGVQEQLIEALQLTTSWRVIYEDGTGTGYESDSPHPLQLRQTAFDEATLYFSNLSAEIMLQFSDDYPPQTLTVQRWPSEYAYGSQDIQEYLGDCEHVTLSGNSIQVDDDGHNYIYEVIATWPDGRSYYSFRMFTGRQH